jgi:hypothetical protein
VMSSILPNTSNADCHRVSCAKTDPPVSPGECASHCAPLLSASKGALGQQASLRPISIPRVILLPYGEPLTPHRRQPTAYGLSCQAHYSGVCATILHTFAAPCACFWFSTLRHMIIPARVYVTWPPVRVNKLLGWPRCNE